jgi:hypothetical protein
MTLNDALNQIIDDGIEAARFDLSKPTDRLKREGSITGLEECRGKRPSEIAALLVEAETRSSQAIRDRDPIEHYWYWRCRAFEIEWVANVLSCVMHTQGWRPITPHMTARGIMKAAKIMGVSEDRE